MNLNNLYLVVKGKIKPYYACNVGEEFYHPNAFSNYSPFIKTKKGYKDVFGNIRYNLSRDNETNNFLSIVFVSKYKKYVK